MGKLSYMDQREYDQIEERIMEGEEEQERLQLLMDSSETMANPQLLESVWADLERAKREVEELYARWDELEEKKEAVISRRYRSFVRSFLAKGALRLLRTEMTERKDSALVSLAASLGLVRQGHACEYGKRSVRHLLHC